MREVALDVEPGPPGNWMSEMNLRTEATCAQGERNILPQLGGRSSGAYSKHYFHGFRPQVRVCLQAHLPHGLSNAAHGAGGEVKLAPVYLRGMGMTGIKLR